MSESISMLTAIAVCGLAVTPSLAADHAVIPAWPDRDLAKFVFEHLDLSSFRNSTGPRRKAGQRFFTDLGIRPNRVTDDEALSDDGEWLYSVRILGKADYNKDGEQEVLICFHDTARNGGSYRTVNHYVVQLVEGRAIALATTETSRAEAAGCKSSR